MSSGMGISPSFRPTPYQIYIPIWEELRCEDCCPPEDEITIKSQDIQPDLQHADWDTDQPPYYHHDIF